MALLSELLNVDVCNSVIPSRRSAPVGVLKLLGTQHPNSKSTSTSKHMKHSNKFYIPYALLVCWYVN